MRPHVIAVLCAFAIAPLAAPAALASDKTDVMATIKQYNDAFTKNDDKTANALCTDNAVIIDDFAPHVWQGATACADWWKSFGAMSAQDGDSNGWAKLGKAAHILITDDRAYAVYPATFHYRHKGKPMAEKGLWTFAMQKTAVGWRISGWSWAQQ